MTDSGSPTLIVFGEALLDDFPHQKVLGGAPFNVARASASLGCAPLMISRVGNDGNGQLVRDEMRRFALDQSGMQTDTVHPTGLVKVHVELNAHRFEIMTNQAYDHIECEPAVLAVDRFKSMQQGRQQPTLIYYGTLAQRNKTSRETLTRLLSAGQSTNYLDLNLRDGQYSFDEIVTSLLHADILKVNEDELQLLVRKCQPEAGQLNCDLNSPEIVDAFFEALQHLLVLFKLRAIIVTLGAQGYVYMNDQGVRVNGWQTETPQLALVDTVGCGDAFSSVFLAGLMHGWPTELTLQRAHAFAGSVCTIRGAVSTDMKFYRDWQTAWGLNATPDTAIGQAQ
ncbi:fructokinase [Oxalobacteraceae bacterium GrIS 2.11]